MLFLLLLADAVLTQAARDLDAGRVAAARPVLEQRVAARPADGEAWALLARALWLERRAPQAAAAARRADTPRATPETQHALALYYAQSGNRPRAAELEGRYALSPAADAFAPARAALLHFETGQVTEAIRFGELADRHPARPEVVLMLARAHESRRDIEKSLARYDQLLRLRPEDEESWSQAGQAHLRAARFAGAVKVLEEGVQRFAQSAQLHLALGVAYYGQRRFDEAGQRFLRTLDIDPAIEQPYVFLARMIDQLEPWWSAIEPAFRAWHQRETRSHLPPFVLARLLLARGGAAARAEALLRESLARQADFPDSHFELGGVLEQRRQWAEAAAAYETAARLRPDFADAFYRLARVYVRLQQPEKAASARARHQQLSAAVPAAGMAERR